MRPLNRLFGERSMPVAALRRFGMSVVTRQPLLRRTLIERALGLGGDVPALATRATSPRAGTTPMNEPPRFDPPPHAKPADPSDRSFTQSPPTLGNQFDDDPLLGSWIARAFPRPLGAMLAPSCATSARSRAASCTDCSWPIAATSQC